MPPEDAFMDESPVPLADSIEQLPSYHTVLAEGLADRVIALEAEVARLAKLARAWKAIAGNVAMTSEQAHKTYRAQLEFHGLRGE